MNRTTFRIVWYFIMLGIIIWILPHDAGVFAKIIAVFAGLLSMLFIEIFASDIDE